MTNVRKLDLGGTACYVSEDGVGISLEGSMSDDEVTPAIRGDYNRAPFPADTFDEAFGTCYFEDTYDLKELHRVLKPDAEAVVSSCGDLPSFRELAKLVRRITREAHAAGFTFVWAEMELTPTRDGRMVMYRFPQFHLTK